VDYMTFFNTALCIPDHEFLLFCADGFAGTSPLRIGYCDSATRPFGIAVSKTKLRSHRRFKPAAPRDIHENLDSEIESTLGLWGLWILLFSI